MIRELEPPYYLVPAKATVYYGARNRRFLTKIGAYKSLARNAILNECDCGFPEGFVCSLHKDPDLLDEVVDQAVSEMKEDDAYHADWERRTGRATS